MPGKDDPKQKPDEMLSVDEMAEFLEKIPAELPNGISKENDSKYVTIGEAVSFLKIKPSRLNYHLKGKKVPALLKGKKIYYSKKELIAAITED